MRARKSPLSRRRGTSGTHRDKIITVYPGPYGRLLRQGGAACFGRAVPPNKGDQPHSGCDGAPKAVNTAKAFGLLAMKKGASRRPFHFPDGISLTYFRIISTLRFCGSPLRTDSPWFYCSEPERSISPLSSRRVTPAPGAEAAYPMIWRARSVRSALLPSKNTR